MRSHLNETSEPPIVDVLIAGGGPVGLSLAIELGRRGVEVLLVEPKAGVHEHPRSTVINQRTMEYFRAWGIDEEVVANAVPLDYPLDVAFTMRLVGEEFDRLTYPTIGESLERSDSAIERYPPLAWSRYAKMVIGQNNLEPILLATARSQGSVTLEHESAVVSFEAGNEWVDVLVDTGGGHIRTVRARYLIGCDGGRSVVRKALGSGMAGAGALGESVSIFFRAPDLLKVINKRPAFLFWTLASGATGSFIAIDGIETWVHSRHLLPGETYEGFDPIAAIRSAVGVPLDIEIISHWPWIPRELVANEYSRGRVHLAGDAAHLMSPTGGLGLNTGVGDVMNLAWKLQARLQGWGGEGLLDTYMSERKPVAIRNSQESTENRGLMKATMLAGGRLDRLEDPEAARHELIAGLPLHAKHFDTPGAALGDDYGDSAIVVADGSAPIRFDSLTYEPVARPGRRLPDLWLTPEVSVHDRLSTNFTLLHPEGDNNLEPLLEAFAQKGVPVDTLALPPPLIASYGAPLLIVRPDGHVAWRGRRQDDFAKVVDHIRGATRITT